MFKKMTVAALLSAITVEEVHAAAGVYSYLQNGADWPFMAETECMKGN